MLFKGKFIFAQSILELLWLFQPNLFFLMKESYRYLHVNYQFFICYLSNLYEFIHRIVILQQLFSIIVHSTISK